MNAKMELKKEFLNQVLKTNFGIRVVSVNSILRITLFATIQKYEVK